MTIREYAMKTRAIDRDRAGEVAGILETLARAGTEISREVRRAALSGRTGYSGGENKSGERQKKLDVAGNDVVLGAFTGGGPIAAIVSEEDDTPVPTATPEAPWMLCTDPIDGSSNTDVNGPLGTIFSISRRRADGRFPQGSDIAAAGYILYGPSTIMAFSAGDGAAAFTLDEDQGGWVMTHPALRCPARAPAFSANLGRQGEWHPHLRAWLDWATSSDGASGRPYSLRYIGSLTADLHRCLIEGGLYFYPPDPKHKDGKLRLLYECAPLAFLTEQAGGRASTGAGRVLDVEATAAHQRCPLVIGSADEVALFETFMRTGRPQ
jgi:fructose-1,6-bisphosphatase I